MRFDFLKTSLMIAGSAEWKARFLFDDDYGGGGGGGGDANVDDDDNDAFHHYCCDFIHVDYDMTPVCVNNHDHLLHAIHCVQNTSCKSVKFLEMYQISALAAASGHFSEISF